MSKLSDLVPRELEAGDLFVLGRVGAVEGFDVFFDEEGEVDEACAFGVEDLVASDACVRERRDGVSDGVVRGFQVRRIRLKRGDLDRGLVRCVRAGIDEHLDEIVEVFDKLDVRLLRDGVAFAFVIVGVRVVGRQRFGTRAVELAFEGACVVHVLLRCT